MVNFADISRDYAWFDNGTLHNLFLGIRRTFIPITCEYLLERIRQRDGK